MPQVKFQVPALRRPGMVAMEFPAALAALVLCHPNTTFLVLQAGLEVPIIYQLLPGSVALALCLLGMVHLEPQAELRAPALCQRGMVLRQIPAH